MSENSKKQPLDPDIELLDAALKKVFTLTDEAEMRAVNNEQASYQSVVVRDIAAQFARRAEAIRTAGQPVGMDPITATFTATMSMLAIGILVGRQFERSVIAKRAEGADK